MALLQEFRFSACVLARNKAWTAVATLTLALGLGANVAIFSTVGLMVWTPIPYPNPEQLVWLPQTNPQKGVRNGSAGLADARDWAQATALASVAAYQTRPLAVSGQGEPQHLPAMQVTPSFFDVLRVRPALGRAFRPEESPETESRVAIVSHALWQGMFRGDGGVLGREIRLDGRSYSIVGVMPQGFAYLYQPNDVWIPLSLAREQRERGWRGVQCIGRLQPGVSMERAAAEVRAISERVEREDTRAGLGWRGDARPIAARVMGRGARAAATTMFGAVGLVLLIACSNVASLLLARGAQRRREFALRASLGAGRAALIRLQLAESLLLSLLGGAAGVLAAVWTIPAIRGLAPPEMIIFQAADLNWSALAFGAALSLAAGVVSGLAPAWLLTRGDPAPALQESARGSTGASHRFLKSLVVAQIALALVLVAASTLMIRSLIRQTTMDLGFDRTHLAMGRVLLSPARYPEERKAVDFFTRTLDELRRDRSLEQAALVQTIPLGGESSYVKVRIEGEEDASLEKVAGFMRISPAYFAVMRIPVVAGREFTDADDGGAAEVAIVNETFARRYWPRDRNPVGRRIQVPDEKTGWLTAVGVARDVRRTNLLDPPRPEIYRPLAQAPARTMMVVARGRGSADAAVGAVRAGVARVDSEQPVFQLEKVDSALYRRASGERATAKVLTLLAAIALALAAVGAYGVMSYTAAQRMREIGIRLALGATQRDVFRMLLRGGAALALAGLAIGVPLTYGATPLLRTVAEAVEPLDVLAYAGVAVLLLVVTVAASLAPARRAMRVDPGLVLRNE
jgi:putative ABC transport system permease protein